MPSYDYLCEANEQVLEVSHPMRDSISTWGELCTRLGIDPGKTPSDAPVRKLITGGGIVRSGALKNPELPPCQTGGGCGGSNSCAFH